MPAIAARVKVPHTRTLNLLILTGFLQFGAPPTDFIAPTHVRVAAPYGAARLDSTELTARRQRTGTTEGEDTSPHPHSPKQADAFTPTEVA